ncbi:uncharacterized protein L201_002844 [Kwoniella dendrophila CBS 6074]|uniref:Protein kinase domain-containing protein n=1 Tax=Kwoniella dendrophila CBS 6074 TaxID=1295534 RepID=A0AAX4JRK1_9TREE
MSFSIEFQKGCEPNRRSHLSNGLTFSRHPKPKSPISKAFILNKPSIMSDISLAIGANNEQNLVPNPIIKVKIVAYLAAGNLWDYWLAIHPFFGKVVIKAIYLLAYPCENPNYDNYVPSGKVEVNMLKEEKFYLGPLLELQGKVVPKYYGSYCTGGNGHYMIMMLEYVGRSMGFGILRLNDNTKVKLYEAYKQLHIQGVSHHDICGRHILIDDMGGIRLVGFRYAYQRKLHIPDQVRDLISEDWVVKARTGMESDDANSLTSAHPEYWAKLKDPTAFYHQLVEDEIYRRKVYHLPPLINIPPMPPLLK